MRYSGTDNTLGMPDHYNHIHIGFYAPFAQPARISSVPVPKR